MHRRSFIAALAAGTWASASSAVAQAQRNAEPRRIGVLTAGDAATAAPRALLNELRAMGWIEGQNLLIERRGGEGNAQRVPALAAELAQMKLDAVVTFGAVAGIAMRDATTAVPIVAITGDPVRLGLVPNLSHPGGNITGLSLISPELAAKRLELMRECIPHARLIGELVDPANTYWQRERPEYEQTFRSMGLQPLFVEVASPGEIEKAIAQIAGRRADALVIRGDPMFASNREAIARWAVQYALPTIAEGRNTAEAGALMSYGASAPAAARIVASCVDKILRGARPGDLAVAQPTEFELVINLRTARALALTIPPSLLRRADEVIK